MANKKFLVAITVPADHHSRIVKTRTTGRIVRRDRVRTPSLQGDAEMAIRFFAVALASMGLAASAFAQCPCAPKPVCCGSVAVPTCGTCAATTGCSTCSTCATPMYTSRRAARRGMVMMPMNSMVMPATYTVPMTAMAMPMTGGIVQAQSTTPTTEPTPQPTPMPGSTVTTTGTMMTAPAMVSTATPTRRHLFPRLFARRY